MKILLSVALTLCLTNVLPAVEVPLDVKQSSLKFIGHSFLHDFKGEAKQFSGSAEMDTQIPSVVSTAKIDIQAAKLTTFESERDRNMFDWLHIDVNPDITFHLTKVTLVSGDPAHATKDHPAQFTVEGQFTLNKIATPLQAQAEGWREGSLLVVTGTTKVDTASHDLPIVKKLFMTVGKDVDIDFHLAFDLPPELRLSVVP
jgi:polyisoprenoid-binding protein YceI